MHCDMHLLVLSDTARMRRGKGEGVGRRRRRKSLFGIFSHWLSPFGAIEGEDEAESLHPKIVVISELHDLQREGGNRELGARGVAPRHSR
jgi:hypothetical protein